MKTTVKFSDIEIAVDFVSGDGLIDCIAYIDKSTGEARVGRKSAASAFRRMW